MSESGPIRGEPCECIHGYNAYAMTKIGKLSAPGPFGTINSVRVRQGVRATRLEMNYRWLNEYNFFWRDASQLLLCGEISLGRFDEWLGRNEHGDPD